MASLSYIPRFVDIIPQTWPPRDILLVLWPPYLKHGLLELCSRFVAIKPQTWLSRVILLVLWTSYLKHVCLIHVFCYRFFPFFSREELRKVYTMELKLIHEKPAADEPTDKRDEATKT